MIRVPIHGRVREAGLDSTEGSMIEVWTFCYRPEFTHANSSWCCT